MNRNLYISPSCEYSKKMLIGLSNHGLLKYFTVIDVTKNLSIPPFVTGVPLLENNGTLIKGEQLFNYMNQFATKILQGNNSQKSPLQRNVPEKEPSLDTDFEGWCKDDSCSIGFSNITETNDNCKEGTHKFLESHFYLSNETSSAPTQNTENMTEKEKILNSQYEQMMKSREQF